MRFFIEKDGTAEDQDEFVQFNPKLTTLESLYEPYKLVWNPYNDDDNDDDNDDEIVMRSGITFSVPSNTPSGYNISYFQPGFDYEIYRCDILNGETVTYNVDFTFDRYIDTIPSFDQQGHSIKILQISDELDECHPYFMTTRTVVSGSIYNHNTNQINELDSININSPDLLQNLPNGIIHTININTNEGETFQKSIIKDED